MRNTQRKGRKETADKAGKEIKRLWGDLKVVDAKNDLRVFIRPEDVDQAVRKDPSCCVFARACKRIFGASKVLFFRSIAYVEMPDNAGIRHVERFTMSPEMRDLVESFDKGESVIPEAGFLLKAPTPGRQFERARRLKIERREEIAARRKLVGTAEYESNNQGKGKYRDKPLVLDLAVRSGTGAVQFFKGKDAD